MTQEFITSLRDELRQYQEKQATMRKQKIDQDKVDRDQWVAKQLEYIGNQLKKAVGQGRGCVIFRHMGWGSIFSDPDVHLMREAILQGKLTALGLKVDFHSIGEWRVSL